MPHLARGPATPPLASDLLGGKCVSVVAPPAIDRRVHVILPLFNEAASVPKIVAETATFLDENPSYQVLFVDDGSTDGTPAALAGAVDALAARAPDIAARLRATGYRTNAGKGYAIARAVSEVRAPDDDLLLFTDGDLAYPLKELPRVARMLATADVVIGSRRGPEGGYRAHPIRNVMGWTYNRLARLCLGRPYRDTQAGLKGFRMAAARRLFRNLRMSGFAFDVELLFLAQRFGYRIAEIPVAVGPDHRKKPSRVSLLRDPRRMFVSLAAVRIDGALGRYERQESGRKPMVLMSFDTEEFDAPADFGRPVDPPTQARVAIQGMEHALDVLAESGARCTFFTTARFASSAPHLVRSAVAQGHEIASHGLVHTGYRDEHLAESRRQLEAIAGAPVVGFRPPRFAPASPSAIARAGYTYCSSINPIWLPGRYNHLRAPRRPHPLPLEHGPDGEPAQLWEIPLSATPWIRFPLFWLAFKNAPQWWIRTATRWCLASDGYVALCFHPWELCDLSGSGLPRYVRRIDGASMRNRLVRYLRWLSLRGRFAPYRELAGRCVSGRWPAAPDPGSG